MSFILGMFVGSAITMVLFSCVIASERAWCVARSSNPTPIFARCAALNAVRSSENNREKSQTESAEKRERKGKPSTSNGNSSPFKRKERIT